MFPPLLYNGVVFGVNVFCKNIQSIFLSTSLFCFKNGLLDRMILENHFK